MPTVSVMYKKIPAGSVRVCRNLILLKKLLSQDYF